MKLMNVIVVYDRTRSNILMCLRRKDPYKGKLNFVGGKLKPDETGLEAAYRELQEETAITAGDISLVHLMDLTYHTYRIQIQVYIGRLNKVVEVHGDENQLLWLPADSDFEDMSRFAGEGNIAHIIEMIRDDIDNLLPDYDT
jgi:8-oxo-dGTP diphosphatase